GNSPGTAPPRTGRELSWLGGPVSSIAPHMGAPVAEAGGELRSLSTHLALLATGFDHRRLLVASIFMAIFAGHLGRPTDIDYWWHLRAGELIARTGAVPTTDPFSYTASGQPWVAHEWLWELGVYWLTQLGGFRLVLLTSALMVASTYVLLYRLIRQLGANQLVAGSLTVWAFL